MPPSSLQPNFKNVDAVLDELKNLSAGDEINISKEEHTITKADKAKKGPGHPRTTRRTIQACLKRTTLSSDPGKWYPSTQLTPVNGTKEKESQVLSHPLLGDESNLFKELYAILSLASVVLALVLSPPNKLLNWKDNSASPNNLASSSSSSSGLTKVPLLLPQSKKLFNANKGNNFTANFNQPSADQD